MYENQPEWYLTVEEFANLVVQSLEETNHFKRGERAHPEDIGIAFATHAAAIAVGAGAMARKMFESSNKNAVMQTGNIKKSKNIESQEDFLGYSEWKNSKNANI